MSFGLISEDEIKLLSVGIDVGSSTSHLVFSRLTLQKDPTSSSRRFHVVEREVIYSSEIINTPLIDKETIDIPKVVDFFKSAYQEAEINPKDVGSGVVIVTGETAKKKNAGEIVNLLAEDAGTFVAATAGPNFESVIAAFGSGATKRSEENGHVIISCDIGGGTSNIAVSYQGNVLSTSCISVGGRLLGFDNEGKLNRIDQPAQLVLDDLGLTYVLGDNMLADDIQRVCDRFAEILLESITGPVRSDLGKKLMMTTDLEIPENLPLEYSFSGGVAEYIYKQTDLQYNDIGLQLGQSIMNITGQLPGKLVEPENKIRATVIGAGCYTLQVSGSTSFLDDDTLEFPLRNIPVLRAHVNRELLSEEHVISEITKSFEKFDLIEGEQIVALAFADPVRAAYQKLKLFAQSIEKALQNSVAKEIPIVLIFERDIGNSVGNVIRRETAIKDKLISIDEIAVEEGDWIDIGAPLINGQVVPVTVKSLVFSKNNS